LVGSQPLRINLGLVNVRGVLITLRLERLVINKSKESSINFLVHCYLEAQPNFKDQVNLKSFEKLLPHLLAK